MSSECVCLRECVCIYLETVYVRESVGVCAWGGARICKCAECVCVHISRECVCASVCVCVV